MKKEINEHSLEILAKACMIFFIIYATTLTYCIYKAYKEGDRCVIEGEELVAEYRELRKDNIEIVEVPVIVCEDIYSVAERVYEVDSDLLVAIERHETGNYTSSAYLELNNTHGRMMNDELRYYDNTDESTLSLARMLRYNYFDEGLETIEDIASKYLPQDQQEEWIASVTTIYNNLKEES